MRLPLLVQVPQGLPGVVRAVEEAGYAVDPTGLVCVCRTRPSGGEPTLAWVGLADDADGALQCVEEGADAAVVWPGRSDRLERALGRAFEVATERALHEAYETLFKMCDAWLEVTNGEVEWIDVSDGFSRQTGYRRDEVVGRTPAQLFRSGLHGRDFYQAQFHELTTTGRWAGDMLSQRRDGSTAVTDVQLGAVLVGRHCLAHLAHRKVAGADSVGSMKAWLDGLCTAPWLLARRDDGSLLDAHPGLSPVLERQEQRLVGLTCEELGLHWERCAPGERVQYDAWFGDRAFEVHVVGSVAGDVDVVAMVFHDITQRKLEAEKLDALAHDLALARDQALAAGHAKSAFLASMSHELRTPLNAILGYSELLEEDIVEPDAVADLRRIQTSGRHLLSLVDDVLDLARVEAGAVEVQMAPIDAAEVVAEAAQSLRLRAAKRGMRIVSRCTGGTVYTDGNRVRQVLINLMGNAVKYAVPGEIRVVQQGTTFTVEDEGPGIPAEDLPTIFQPFHQLGDSNPGVGLGLAICRRIAEALGAELDVSSEVGVGTRFTLTLPAAALTPVDCTSRQAGRHT